MIELSNDAYGRTVVMSSNGITDTYLVGGAIVFNFPAGTATPVAYLAFAKQMNLFLFKSALRDFTDALYDSFTRQQLTNLYLAAVEAGLTNRKAYLAQILLWTNAVTEYVANYMASVNGAVNANAITDLVFDSTQFMADPKITASAAAQIPD